MNDREMVGGPVRGEEGKTWGFFTEGLWERHGEFFESDTFGQSTRDGNIALGCVKCQTVTRLKPCPNCSGVAYVVNAGSLSCILCTQGFHFWNCSSCDCKNPVGPTTLLLKQTKGSCFIATAVYGGKDHPDVIYLSTFREEALSNIRLGRMLISAYYFISPPLAAIISRSKLLQKMIGTIVLRPILFLLRLVR